MPRVENLVGFHIAAVKSRELDEPTDNGEAEVAEVWTLVLTDYQTKDQIRIAFRREARDALVRQLADGIVLAGGGFPQV
jgi:hypothetical protein